MIRMYEESQSIVFLNDISYTGQHLFMINSYKIRPYAEYRIILLIEIYLLRNFFAEHPVQVTWTSHD